MAVTKKNKAALYSEVFYIEIAPSKVGLFRFLLEAYDNFALFTVLDKYKAILKIFYSPHQEKEVKQTIKDILKEIN